MLDIRFPGVEFDTQATLDVFAEHYADMFDRQHVLAGDSIIIDPHGVIRFKPERLGQWIADTISLNRMVMECRSARDGALRQRIYKDMGYSLCGYLEVFGTSDDDE